MRFAVTKTKLPKCINRKKTWICNKHNKINIKHMHTNKQTKLIVENKAK